MLSEKEKVLLKNKAYQLVYDTSLDLEDQLLQIYCDEIEFPIWSEAVQVKDDILSHINYLDKSLIYVNSNVAIIIDDFLDSMDTAETDDIRCLDFYKLSYALSLANICINEDHHVYIEWILKEVQQLALDYDDINERSICYYRQACKELLMDSPLLLSSIISMNDILQLYDIDLSIKLILHETYHQLRYQSLLSMISYTYMINKSLEDIDISQMMIHIGQDYVPFHISNIFLHYDPKIYHISEGASHILFFLIYVLLSIIFTVLIAFNIGYSMLVYLIVLLMMDYIMEVIDEDLVFLEKAQNCIYYYLTIAMEKIY